MSVVISLKAMEIKIGSIVVIIVILRNVLVKGIGKMNEEQFNREKNYRVAIAIAKSMLVKEIIDKKDYKKINKLLVKKYNPVVGAL